MTERGGTAWSLCDHDPQAWRRKPIDVEDGRGHRKRTYFSYLRKTSSEFFVPFSSRILHNRPNRGFELNWLPTTHHAFEPTVHTSRNCLGPPVLNWLGGHGDRRIHNLVVCRSPEMVELLFGYWCSWCYLRTVAGMTDFVGKMTRTEIGKKRCGIVQFRLNTSGYRQVTA